MGPFTEHSKSNLYWERKSFVVEYYFGNAYGGNILLKWRFSGDSLM